ncbi:MAG: 23S rRNA (adenine(2503)-C(2))-methyltransferase [Acidobacteria bacterium RIFCSPLOWO2_02_FULL_61_28]|nr:MAG: 23S rRNA (adenine(2503)-C(2))-methyltransferase [Acidobacteria bacterium RIFCSPLOWO2_02_FULL_61_28]
MQKQELLGLTAPELEQLLADLGEPPYRGKQLYHALYHERQWDLGKVTPFPAALRARLSERFQVTLPETEKTFDSRDGTRRTLFRLADGCKIETVRMPEPGRDTICVSTQVGCPVDCKFCLTGVMGFTRNLTAGEIVGQVLRVMATNPLEARQRFNLVFMGMGEPLLNFDNVMAALKLLTDPAGIGISWTRITLSTAGVVPGIERLGREPLRPKLAVSLNATTDELRSRIMPINRKWPLAELLRACREFPLRPREKLTFEYVLLEGVNDTVADARRLAQLVRGIRAKVNLIGLNPGPDLPFRTPRDETVLRFQQTLIQKGIPAFIRKPRGRDIFAACGQLKLMEAQPASSTS